jgi:Lon protease-like protein
MADNLKQEISLPNTIPIFPLNGVVMFPDTYLPLNIFEPRYLKMIDHAISNEHRLIGMIQPKNSNESDKKSLFYRVGCAGKIIKFEETDDNRYLITLRGLSRFNLVSEKTNDKNFREANINWENFKKDLDITSKSSDFSTLKITLKKYFKSKNIRANMDAIDTFNDYNFVDQITMICPFENNEKQLLLETTSISKRERLLQTILDSYITEDNISDISKH